MLFRSQRIESLLAIVCATENADESARNARQLWSVIHALVNTALTPKLGVLPQATTTWMRGVKDDSGL